MNPIHGLPDPLRRKFRPPFCPNPKCAFRQPDPQWRPHKDGFFTRPSDRVRVQRFRCPHCRRKFSSQTFSTTYWLKRRSALIPIATHAVEGSGLRQIARILTISHSTVARHLARCGRHCMLFHRKLLEGCALDEPLVVDGFETFEYSQYFPFHANLAVGAESWMLYHFTDSPLRRKGKMTDGQKKRRAELEEALGRPDPKAVEVGMAALVRPLLKMVVGESLLLHSDDHPAYRRSLKRLREEQQECPKLDHCVTSSTVRRTRSNPLFPVNLADNLLRHSSANHRRETIAFSKRRQAALERLAAFTVWRNCIKQRREKDRQPAETAAMHAGVCSRSWTWRQVLGRRLFPEGADLPWEWRDYYWREVKTLALGARQTAHTCQYAF